MGVRTVVLAAVPTLVAGCVFASGCSFDTSGASTASDAGADAAWRELKCLDSDEYVSREGTAHLYRFDKARTYDEGFAECAADGAHMVVIDDQAENDYVLANISATTWIGLDDLTIEGAFEWVDGSPLVFDAFRQSEPNNSGDEDCTFIFQNGGGDSGLWNDDGCNAVHDVVCECDPTFSVNPPPTCMNDSDYDQLEYRGRRYFLGDLSTWQDGRSTCAEDGADLVVIGDIDEDLFVFSQATGGLDVWLGYTDELMEGTFQWVNGSPVFPEGYENWTPGQPNDDSQDDDQDCVEYIDSEAWHDRDCLQLNKPLCECDPSGR